jgi:GT2 family glycosyltransferase
LSTLFGPLVKTIKAAVAFAVDNPVHVESVVPRVAINIVRYNQAFELVEKCTRSALGQEFDDFTVTLTENGSTDSMESAILAQFGSNPRFRYLDNKTNLGFAGAHNLFFRNSGAEFVMPLNPDTVMPRDYLSLLLRAFDDPLVAAAEGKMLKPEPLPDGSWVLDGTGMVISRTRKARERGHLEVDRQQYDMDTDVFGVSGTASAYRMAALERVKMSEAEYFDEDFFTYWEDLDLSWRLRLAGYSCAYVPEAVIFHSRFAGQSKEGISLPVVLARHIRSLPLRVVRWDWRNHFFAILKNDFGSNLLRDLPFIVVREVGLLCFLMAIRPRIIGAIPEVVRLLPRILRKRRVIQRERVATSKDMSRWFLSG